MLRGKAGKSRPQRVSLKGGQGMPFEKEELFKREELEKTAELCRIFLTEEEKRALEEELAPFLLMARALSDLPDQGAFEEAQPSAKVREDAVKESLQRARLLSCAPEQGEGFFLFSKKEEQKGI